MNNSNMHFGKLTKEEFDIKTDNLESLDSMMIAHEKR